MLQDKVQKERPEPLETNEEFSTSRKRRLTRVKVRKKDKNESKQAEDPKRQKVELKGPRVKHVCRSASIVLGQPIATFPVQEEKDKSDKTIPFDDDSNLISSLDKDTALSDMSSGDSEVDTENKVPPLIEPVVAKESDAEMQPETKKKKTETLATAKSTKSESSEDETIMDLLPKKSIMKPLTNITNVSIVFFIITPKVLVCTCKPC